MRQGDIIDKKLEQLLGDQGYKAGRHDPNKSWYIDLVVNMDLVWRHFPDEFTEADGDLSMLAQRLNACADAIKAQLDELFKNVGAGMTAEEFISMLETVLIVE